MCAVIERSGQRSLLSGGRCRCAFLLSASSGLLLCGGCGDARTPGRAVSAGVRPNRRRGEQAGVDRQASRGCLRIEPAVPDFGVVPCGSRRELQFSATNQTREQIKLARFRISCDCLTVIPLSTRIAPGETTVGRLILDLTEEPTSQGDLALEVEGLSDDETCLVRFDVKAQVRPSGPPTQRLGIMKEK